MTPRDRVWWIVTLMVQKRNGFAVRDVRDVAQEAFKEDAPSRRTIDNTIKAMVELGYLERLGEEGRAAHYIPAE